MDYTKSRSASVSSSGNRNRALSPPLSEHGMPKSPSPRPADGSLQPQRFSGGLPASPRPSEPPLTPMSPPPMSARSIGTFIDSEPSTPAYSPRPDAGSWDSSTLVLLSPMPSTPRTPAEPAWEMMVPIQKAPKKRPSRFSRSSRRPSLAMRPTIDEKEVCSNTSLSSHPPVPHSRSLSQKEIRALYKQDDTIEEHPEEKKEEQEQPQSAPLDKLATKVKALWRRKSDTDKKTEKKWKGYDLQRMETSHWTEL